MKIDLYTKLSFQPKFVVTTLVKFLGKARLNNMLVCRHPVLFFRVHPAGWGKKNYHFEMEKIALILIFNIFVR